MTAPLADEITIECIALRLGCRAELIRKAAQMPDYDPALLAARRANFIASIQAHEADGAGLWDPRTREQKDLDEFTNEVIETRKGDYPR
jgi:hypothetical protein